MGMGTLVWVALLCLLAAMAALACRPESTPTNTPVQGSTVAPTAADGLTVEPFPTAVQLPITVAAVPEDLPSYDRDDWRHWTDEDRDCQNTRHEVLIEESRIPVEFKDEDDCKVEAGEWFGAYTGVIVTDPTELDIDHLVPLANAHKSGGWAWSSQRKRNYANSLDDPGHLIAVTSAANRMKGAKGPEDWQPANEAYRCQYALDWINVKQTWELAATIAEASALQDMLATCDNPIELAPEKADPVANPPVRSLRLQGPSIHHATRLKRLASSGCRVPSDWAEAFPATWSPARVMETVTAWCARVEGRTEPREWAALTPTLSQRERGQLRVLSRLR